MSKIKQTTFGLTIENIEQQSVDQGVIETEFNWKLVRERDGLTCKSKEVMWLEWGEDGRFNSFSMHNELAVGRSLLMSPFNQFFTWQTTPVTEIVEQREDYVKFKTKNSNYELFKIENNTDR